MEGYVNRKSTGFLGLIKKNYAQIMTEDKSLTRESLKSYYNHFFTANNIKLARMMTMATLFSKNTLVFYSDDKKTDVVRMYHLNDMGSLSYGGMDIHLSFPNEVVHMTLSTEEEVGNWVAALTACMVNKVEINEESEFFVSTRDFYLAGNVYEPSTLLKIMTSAVNDVVSSVVHVNAPPSSPVTNVDLEDCVGTEVAPKRKIGYKFRKMLIKYVNAEVQTENGADNQKLEVIKALGGVLELGPVKYEGYLLKMGSLLSYNVRYFVLTEDGMFHFFKSKESEGPAMSLSTKKCELVLISKEKFTFDLKFDEAVFHLKGDCKETMDAWVRALTE